MSTAAGFAISIVFCLLIIGAFYLGYLAGENQLFKQKHIDGETYLKKMACEEKGSGLKEKDSKLKLEQVVGKNKITFDSVYEALKSELLKGPEEN